MSKDELKKLGEELIDLVKETDSLLDDRKKALTEKGNVLKDVMERIIEIGELIAK